MPGPLLLTGTRVLATALFTATLCTAATVAIALAAGEIAYAAWLGMVGALVGLLGGVVAGLGAAAAGVVLTRRGASVRVQRWVQPVAGGLGAGACAAVVVSGPVLQGVLAAVGVFFMAAAAVVASAAKRDADTVSP